MTGTITHIALGYGFIHPDDADDGTGIFFFHNALDSFGPTWADLTIGMRVSFIEIAHPKGPRAIEVRVVSQPTAPPSDLHGL